MVSHNWSIAHLPSLLLKVNFTFNGRIFYERFLDKLWSVACSATYNDTWRVLLALVLSQEHPALLHIHQLATKLPTASWANAGTLWIWSGNIYHTKILYFTDNFFNILGQQDDRNVLQTEKEIVWHISLCISVIVYLKSKTKQQKVGTAKRNIISHMSTVQVMLKVLGHNMLFFLLLSVSLADLTTTIM